jgi:hypothetical protein
VLRKFSMALHSQECLKSCLFAGACELLCFLRNLDGSFEELLSVVRNVMLIFRLFFPIHKSPIAPNHVREKP